MRVASAISRLACAAVNCFLAACADARLMKSFRFEQASVVLPALSAFCAALSFTINAFFVAGFTPDRPLTRAIRSVICSLALLTFTVNVQELVLDESSIARLVTVVVPMGNTVPLFFEYVRLLMMPQLSDATAAG